MHHSKELCFTFKMMLISPRCTLCSTVSFCGYNILYVAHYIPLTCIHVTELLSFSNLNIQVMHLYTQNKTAV